MHSNVHRLTAFLLFFGLASSQASAQSWADKMFSEKKHDFGAVAAGAETVFKFPVQNLYQEDVHIASVRASCGCTSPSIENEWLKSGETGYIVARFNTGTFRGQRGANLTVTIDKPRYAEVQLRVDGYIRRDVVFNPGQIEFGQAAQGSPVEKSVQLSYAGREDWRVTEVTSSNPFVKAELRETQRGGGRVAYDVLVQLLPDAPPGFHRDALMFRTNDRRLAQLPLVWSAYILPSLQVSPHIVFLGDLKAGQPKEQRLLVKSNTAPFIPQLIESESFDIQFERPSEAKQTHLINVVLTPKPLEGPVKCKLIVHTDLPGDPVAIAEVHCQLLAQ